jgi:RimJ/RimL family protein N-acetyltransferase
MAMLENAKVRLLPFDVEDISDEYIEWLNDPVTTRFLDTKLGQTRSMVRAYVQSFTPPNVLMRIVWKPSNTHVGNVSLHSFQPIHRRIELGIMIGRASERGKSIGRQACSLIAGYAFDQLGVNKITAGTVIENGGMSRVFLDLGFTVEGTLAKHFYLEGEYHDVRIFGLLRESFRTCSPPGEE